MDYKISAILELTKSDWKYIEIFWTLNLYGAQSPLRVKGMLIQNDDSSRLRVNG